MCTYLRAFFKNDNFQILTYFKKVNLMMLLMNSSMCVCFFFFMHKCLLICKYWLHSLLTLLKEYLYQTCFLLILFTFVHFRINSYSFSVGQYLSTLLHGTLLWILIIIIIKYFLRLLLTYHGWMYELHGRFSIKTKLWVVSTLVLYPIV